MASKPTGNPMGRPLEFTQEKADLICELTASHPYGLQKLVRTFPDLPSHFAINTWRVKFPDFNAQYAKAKLKQADLLAEECLDIADESHGDSIINSDGFEVCNTEYIARSRLRIDTRKWLASKLLPKQYGDKSAVDVNHSGNLNDISTELVTEKEKDY